MTPAEARLQRFTLVTVPSAVLAVGCCLSVLPPHFVVDALGILTLWLSVSLPVGIIFGHCILSEE